jgi:hypothetical protein
MFNADSRLRDAALALAVDFGFNVGLESSLGIFSVSIGTGT